MSIVRLFKTEKNGTVNSDNIITLKKNDIKSLLYEYGLTPNKNLGQHFLFETNIIKKIVRNAGSCNSKSGKPESGNTESCNSKSADSKICEFDSDSPESNAIDNNRNNTVIEVGPGLGNLTIPLLSAGFTVYAIEKDTVLAKILPEIVEKYAGKYALKRLHVISKDALKLYPEDIKSLQNPNNIKDISSTCYNSAPTTLVGNLPYNVAIKIFLHITENFPSIQNALIMTQTEAAERLCATPKDKKIYGIPSVKASWFGESKIISSSIPGNVFIPAANVKSALIKFTRYNQNNQKSIPEKFDSTTGVAGTKNINTEHAENTYADSASDIKNDVFKLVDLAFSTRRKTLANSIRRNDFLKSLCCEISMEELFEQAKIDIQSRPENLTIDDYVRLVTLAKATKKESHNE